MVKRIVYNGEIVGSNPVHFTYKIYGLMGLSSAFVPSDFLPMLPTDYLSI